jgi:hypothetical protein
MYFYYYYVLLKKFLIKITIFIFYIYLLINFYSRLKLFEELRNNIKNKFILIL